MFSDAAVIVLRQRFFVGKISISQIQATYGCHEDTVRHMLTGKNWFHLPGAKPLPVAVTINSKVAEHKNKILRWYYEDRLSHPTIVVKLAKLGLVVKKCNVQYFLRSYPRPLSSKEFLHLHRSEALRLRSQGYTVEEIAKTLGNRHQYKVSVPSTYNFFGGNKS